MRETPHVSQLKIWRCYPSDSSEENEPITEICDEEEEDIQETNKPEATKVTNNEDKQERRRRRRLGYLSDYVK